MKKIYLLIILFPLLTFSQTQLNGKVIDAITLKPLPFASIVTNTNFGTLADMDGGFFIKTKNTYNSITVSYIGYKSNTSTINNQTQFTTIKLTPSTVNLNEILINAKENPAIPIVKNVIKNKDKNNIEKSLNSFKFDAYNKILVTANPDSINGKVDSIFVVKNNLKKFVKLDSTSYEFKKEIDKQHLYISEKISEYKFQKGKKKKETVLASRMAGLKQPLYEFLSITFQDFSFYNEFYTVAGTKYINPIANNALKHYDYKILDTLKIEGQNSILIYYKPKKIKGFLGIEGVLYINSKSFAITKGIAEIKGIVNVKTIQNYTFFEKENCWFPINMNIVLKKGENNENINLFGGAVKFTNTQVSDTIYNTQKKTPSDVSYFISKTENTNIQLNIPIIVKKAATTIQFNDDANNKADDFWNKYRTDSLTERGKNTYKILDSLSKDEGVENKINLARNILKGYYHTKYINFNLGKVISVNNYEGLRLGIGGETTNNFSNILKIDSYVAYGTKDNDFKYKIGAAARLNKNNNTWIGVNFINDLKEAASLDFISENSSFSPINPRNLNIDKFYNYKTASTYLKHDIQPNLEAKLQFSLGDYSPVFDYNYISTNKNLSNYQLTTATLGFQYNPKNEYMNSPIGKLKMKNNYPQYTLQLTKSFENLLESDFDFTQINFRIFHKIKPIRKGITEILVEGGIVFGDAPITHLYNSTPNYTFKNPWTKRVTFAGKYSFETMGYNEFISDRYLAIHLKQEFEPFKIGAKFKPQLSIVTRAAIGNLDNPTYHNGLNFKTMENGYIESGFELNSLFKGFGFSAFYRYGTYKNPEWSDNLALKLTYKLRLGF